MQGLAKSQQELNKASRAANTGANSIKKFDRAVAGAGRSSRQASAGVKAFGAATVGATGSLKAFGAAMASYLAPVAAIAAAVGALAKSFQIAGEREADARALANGLQKIGAEKGALDSLQASADRLGKTTLLNQEDFTKGYKLLTSFRNIGLSSYEDVSKAAADMSAVLGNDLNSNLLQLAKALENPAKGLSYLSRSGTTFKEEQIELIKTLQASGNILGAQAEILKVVEGQYGDAAEAAGKSGTAHEANAIHSITVASDAARNAWMLSAGHAVSTNSEASKSPGAMPFCAHRLPIAQRMSRHSARTKNALRPWPCIAANPSSANERVRSISSAKCSR